VLTGPAWPASVSISERFGLMTEGLRVWIEQKLCTGDGLCTQLAPEVFEFGDDELAYVKGADQSLLTQVAGAQADVPEQLRLDVIDAADGCPGNCIHVVRSSDGVEVAGPEAD
jgi:ferredoxin